MQVNTPNAKCVRVESVGGTFMVLDALSKCHFKAFTRVECEEWLLNNPNLGWIMR